MERGEELELLEGLARSLVLGHAEDVEADCFRERAALAWVSEKCVRFKSMQECGGDPQDPKT